MSNAQQAITAPAQKPISTSRLPPSIADNTNGRPPIMEPEAPRLTPQLVMAVLREIERCDEDTARVYMDDDGHGLVAAAETTAALDRAGSVRPVVDAMFAQFARWSPVMAVDELHAERSQAGVQALEQLRQTIYAVLGGAYRQLDRYRDPVFEELADHCEEIAKTSHDADVQVAGEAASWMVNMCAYPLFGGSEMDRRTCLGAAHRCASVIGSHLHTARGHEAFDAFIEALRAIPAATLHA